MPLHESTCSNPQYILKYYHNYCFGKWNTCSKGGLPPFLLPHLITSGYPYHQKWLLDLNGHFIADLTWIDMVQQASTMKTYATMMVA